MPSPAAQRSPPLAAAEAWKRHRKIVPNRQSLAFAIP